MAFSVFAIKTYGKLFRSTYKTLLLEKLTYGQLFRSAYKTLLLEKLTLMRILIIVIFNQHTTLFYLFIHFTMLT